MFRVIAGMERDGIYYVDALTQASLPLRFHRRFSPVMRLQKPPALIFEHYSDSTDSSSFQSFELFIAAGESFAAAKEVAARLLSRMEAGAAEGGHSMVDKEWLEEIKGFAKVTLLQPAIVPLSQRRSFD